ncbi:MAG: metalloprotease TldD [Magnetovibrio sp.]|nr:metalloprotease TldD [Magnetovibrio sp.]|tara:strand:- start:7891 stop:9324 length:1434 start_codon:yes stop_codon:yes gene_type:complete
MSDLSKTDNLFFNRAGMDLGRVVTITEDALSGADDGELYLEYCQSEAIVFDDGQLKNASFNTSQGFGLRAVSDEVTGYSHASELNENVIKRAAETVKSVYAGHGGVLSPPPTGTNSQLYVDDNPLSLIDFESKVKLLKDIDVYARTKDERVAQVSASLSGSWQAIQVLRPDGYRAGDIRPLVRLNVTVMVAQGDRIESGSCGAGGRVDYGEYLKQETWKETVDRALRLALLNLESVPAPAGEMEVVLGSGWPGILLHEAIGHGLEGDFNRKKTSAFSGLLGERVAAPGVTVIDDGTISDKRGSLTIDDEGTPTQKTVLIEDGILKGYMQDRMNARLMGVEPTGNGRRQSYAYAPIPRMTNTYMPAGQHDPEEILQSMQNGLYATNFGGGQVDITSGKFVFTCTEAYVVENGKIGAPVKGATLIGNGPDVLTRVSMIGNDFALDPGVGTCGKDGQGVPCGVGQPTIKVQKLTVGGTAA